MLTRRGFAAHTNVASRELNSNPALTHSRRRLMAAMECCEATGLAEQRVFCDLTYTVQIVIGT
ncbi:hypothetical protein JYU34_013336 [Plutella xylostella]|uniref:Uncharacterized protein n=1 Tax=Plutella xylostella TaxID=51655 RepID=A0ABQ7Q9K5_PLUXY|nr:hypothetical protein JYU34_013336 [Plutella xylostella]